MDVRYFRRPRALLPGKLERSKQRLRRDNWRFLSLPLHGEEIVLRVVAGDDKYYLGYPIKCLIPGGLMLNRGRELRRNWYPKEGAGRPQGERSSRFFLMHCSTFRLWHS